MSMIGPVQSRSHEGSPCRILVIYSTFIVPGSVTVKSDSFRMLMTHAAVTDFGRVVMHFKLSHYFYYVFRNFTVTDGHICVWITTCETSVGVYESLYGTLAAVYSA